MSGQSSERYPEKPIPEIPFRPVIAGQHLTAKLIEHLRALATASALAKVTP